MEREEVNLLYNDDLQIGIYDWATETFGANLPQIVTKLDTEHWELQHKIAQYFDMPANVKGEINMELSAIQDEIRDECADVLFMLFQLAEFFDFGLLAAVDEKFERNKKRTWAIQEDGTFQHVTEG